MENEAELFRWTPTPSVIEGDGSRSHWKRRREVGLRSVRSQARETREAWLETAPKESEDE
jgi:hypothetical protein